ncbi:MAG: Trk system potassium transporter TrkA, partial [Firmicutes bacterium]|nr:Trk system potassium transporter TrkA [Bacillota bacterium]
MKIIIIGCGKVGTTLAEQLSQEDHKITVIDNKDHKVDNVIDKLDVLGVYGNGATLPVLKEADVEHTDLVIAVTATDELNMLACLIAKKAGAKNTIARVRNPEYADVISAIKEDMGLSLSINPELACAMEIARVLKFPSMIKVDTFAKGRVELLQFVVPENSSIVGLKLKDLGREHKVLICAAERDGIAEAIIPDGEFTIQANDKLSVVGDPNQEIRFFKQIGIKSDRAKSIMIVGGGKIAYYLAKIMIKVKVDVKIIERNRQRCEELADLLPEAVIIHGDGTNQNILLEEGQTDAEGNLITPEKNSEYGKSPVYAKAYLTFENGPTLVGAEDIQFSLYQLMQALDKLIVEKPAQYRRHNLTARNFYETWKENGMGSWK